ncbi:hypothetical protein ABZ929_12145 [Streptomyces physcomitrii]|uniref:hypothetical protein n=1 Tax=Streptomyces physcomitrii TaxID=2724184 RepID=UPI00340A97B6
MAVWSPEPGEVLLSRQPVVFATGLGPAVKGMRWFRGPERRDIQGELADWPGGPTFSPRSRNSARARGAGRFGGSVLGVVALAILNGGGGVGGWRTPGAVQDSANEIDDFPVLWAAPGETARTLPWQLDPARGGKDQRTHLIVTDRRLVIVAPRGAEIVEDDQKLWEVALSEISGVQLMDYSEVCARGMYSKKSDFRINFSDGSWCRLASQFRGKLTMYLVSPLQIIPPERLSSGQRARVEAFVGGRELVFPPVVTRRESGNYLIQIQVSPKVRTSVGFDAEFDRMGADGQDVEYVDGDLWRQT